LKGPNSAVIDICLPSGRKCPSQAFQLQKYVLESSLCSIICHTPKIYAKCNWTCSVYLEEISGQPQATAFLTAKMESLVSRLGVTQNWYRCGDEEQIRVGLYSYWGCNSGSVNRVRYSC